MNELEKEMRKREIDSAVDRTLYGTNGKHEIELLTKENEELKHKLSVNWEKWNDSRYEEVEIKNESLTKEIEALKADKELALSFCEKHTDQMWAASIVGILLGCGFREAGQKLAALRSSKPNEGVE